MRARCFAVVLMILPMGHRALAQAQDMPVALVYEEPDVGLEKIRALSEAEQGDAAWQAALYWTGRKEFGYAERYLGFIDTIPTQARRPDLAGRVEWLRADISYARGDVEGALRGYQRAAERARGPDAEGFLLAVLERKAGVEHSHGRLAEAAETLFYALNVADAHGKRLPLGRLSYERGMVLYKLGRLAEADKAAAKAKGIFADLKFTQGLAECDKLLGNLCAARGESGQALAHYDAAFVVFKEIGNHLESANCRLNASAVHAKEGRHAKAGEYLDEAIVLYTRAGSVGGVGLCYLNRGQMALEAGDFPKAEKALLTAEKMFADVQNQHRLAQAMRALGELHRRRGDVSKAVDYLTEADRLSDRVAKRN